MSKKELFHKIDSGLFNINIEKDNNLFSEDFDEDYVGQKEKYRKLYKKLLFKASSTIQEQRITRIISIAEATHRINDYQAKQPGKIFPIFKKYIEGQGLLVNYRNFDKMTEEEMVNILEQVNLTNLLDSLDEELKGE